MKQLAEMNSAEKKAELLNGVQGVKNAIRETQRTLSIVSPQAKNLTVTKDLEKLMKAAEKVQMGLQELVL